jgi:hypothetical protein
VNSDYVPWFPKVMKGAIIGLDQFSPLASLIIFQYNPYTLMSSLQAALRG